MKLLCWVLLGLLAANLHAEKLSAVMYGGQWTETDLIPILVRQRTNYRNSNIWALGLNREIATRGPFQIEGEVIAAKHTGLMHNAEACGVAIARLNLPRTPLFLRAGEGISIATENPRLENRNFDPIQWPWVLHSQKSSQVLNYLMFEIGFSLPSSYPVETFLRIHHRSGIFGLLCPPTCGSNFVSYGVRMPIGL
ncbi:MAG: hypothetical protein K8S54_05995 [Spirochaetia bacterium]|nr:hypothetical protein [Spirochaetia bacterium]